MEIESIIYNHPDVLEVAVIHVPAPDLGLSDVEINDLIAFLHTLTDDY